MLSNQSLEISTNFAASLVDKRIRLEATSGSALSEMCAAINNVYRPSYAAKDAKDIVYNLLNASEGTYLNNKTGKTYAMSSHDAFMDDYRAKLTKLVSNYVRFARAVVVPEIKALSEKLTTDLANYKYKEPEDFFAVTYFTPAQVFSTSLIDAEVSAYKAATGYVIDYIGTGKLTTETLDVNTYLLTGDAEIDAAISGWIAQVSAAKVMSYITTEIREYLIDVPELLDYSLANYLFYRNLAEKTDLNLGFSVMQLRTKAANNRAAFGHKLFSALELYAKTIRNKQLLTVNSSVKAVVQPFNNQSYPITVYEESFKAMAEADCPIEALLGFISYEESYAITVPDLVAKRDFYLSKWDNVRSLYIIRLNSSRLEVFKNMLSAIFVCTLGNASEEEQAARKSFSNYEFVANQKFTEYAKTLTTQSIDDIEQICLDVVAGIRFYYSNAHEILANMQRILSMNESMKPDEAALYSVIDYLTDFFVKQIKVTKS